MDQEDKQVSIEGVKNLVIDFGGVIVNLTRNRCIEAFAGLGVDVRDKLTNNYLHKDMFMQLEMGTISTDVFRDSIRQLSPQTLTDRQIDDVWIAMLDDIPVQKLDLLLDLNKRYNTLLLSNTNCIHWEYAVQNLFTYNGYRMKDYFNKIYLSYELHLVKPDQEIFTFVLQDAAIRPEETMLIDDALVNCKSAASLGMRTYMPEPREDWSFLFNNNN